MLRFMQHQDFATVSEKGQCYISLQREYIGKLQIIKRTLNHYHTNNPELPFHLQQLEVQRIETDPEDRSTYINQRVSGE